MNHDLTSDFAAEIAVMWSHDDLKWHAEVIVGRRSRVTGRIDELEGVAPVRARFSHVSLAGALEKARDHVVEHMGAFRWP